MQPAALEQALSGFQTSKNVQHVNSASSCVPLTVLCVGYIVIYIYDVSQYKCCIMQIELCMCVLANFSGLSIYHI